MRLQGHEPPVRHRRQLHHASTRSRPNDAARPVRQRDPLRLGRSASLTMTSPGPRRPSRPAIGAEMHEFVSELFPICRSITGDGVRETLRRIGERVPLELRRGADRHAGLRLDHPARMEHPGRVRARTARAARRRLRGEQPARRRLQRARRRARMSLEELRPHLHDDPGAAGLDPVPDLVLRRGLGVLPEPRSCSGARGGRVRGSASTARSRTGTSPTASALAGRRGRTRC